MDIVAVSSLAECEAEIERAQKTFYFDVGSILQKIRDNRLYREKDYPTFEDYCRERWGMVRQQANRLISAAETVGNLEPMGSILPTNERQARPLTQLEPEQQREAWTEAVERGNGKPTAAIVQQVVDEITEKRPVSYHVSDDSYDWYTPAEYIEAARKVMGGIDLDPASSYAANQIIKADRYFTKDDDGLAHDWAGKVWLNPPYSMPLIEQFVDRVVLDYESGLIECAIVLTNNSTDTGWFHKLIDYPVCLTKGRIQFWNGNEKLATRQGQAIFYLGESPDLFVEVFGVFGAIVRRYDH